MSRISRAIRSIAKASRLRFDEAQMGTDDVLLFRTNTPAVYPIGSTWHDLRDHPWTVTDHRLEEDGRVGIYGTKQ